MSWSRVPQPRQHHELAQCKDVQTRVEDLEWRDRWNTERIERLSTRLVQAERAACELAEQLERVRAERDNLLRSLLKASLEARP